MILDTNKQEINHHVSVIIIFFHITSSIRSIIDNDYATLGTANIIGQTRKVLFIVKFEVQHYTLFFISTAIFWPRLICCLGITKKKAQNLLNCCLVIYSRQNQKMIFGPKYGFQLIWTIGGSTSNCTCFLLFFLRIENIKIYVVSYEMNRMRMVFL